MTGVADAPGAARPSGAAAGGARIAVVTGAAGGIGAAVCRRLARDGFVIACLDSREEAARPGGPELPGSRGYRADVRDPASVHEAGPADPP